MLFMSTLWARPDLTAMLSLETYVASHRGMTHTLLALKLNITVNKSIDDMIEGINLWNLFHHSNCHSLICVSVWTHTHPWTSSLKFIRIDCIYCASAVYPNHWLGSVCGSSHLHIDTWTKAGYLPFVAFNIRGCSVNIANHHPHNNWKVYCIRPNYFLPSFSCEAYQNGLSVIDVHMFF